jgi:aspartate racemase
VEEIIEKELTRVMINDSSRSFFIDLIDWFEDNGAEAAILACTKIPMLISQDDVNCFVVDSTKIHVEAIVDEALSA